MPRFKRIDLAMAHAVFIQNRVSIYSDKPGELYHFPSRYLKAVTSTIGDWVILYESRGHGGVFGYVGVQRVLDVVPDINRDDHYFAIFDQASLITFERIVRRKDRSGVAFETSLRRPDGRAMSGGASVSAVRTLSDAEFKNILEAGFSLLGVTEDIPRSDGFGLSEAQAPFEGQVKRKHQLVQRTFRDASFARQVKHAYAGRCAVSGLELRNGGGRAEVEAAHIKPVADGGPDIVMNGIALSGTIHWMFDRGLISITDEYRLLVSHNKVDSGVAERLFRSDKKILLPEDERFHPHPEFLKYHRETVFGLVG